MSNFTYTNVITNLLNIYERIMYLKIYVDGPNNLKNTYENAAAAHNNKFLNHSDFIDAGFDLYAPGVEADGTTRFFGPGWPNRDPVNKLDFKICCSAKMILNTNNQMNTGFYMYPRSSLSKTRLRLANSVGIIDAGYRGHLMGMFDVVNVPPNENINRTEDYCGQQFDRYAQICAPGLVPIVVEIVNTKEELGEETIRGAGGFGSTGR